MPRDWREITAAHVMEAIRRYDEHPERYTKARHTSIIHEGKEYPAKAIRGIAYEVCFRERLSQEASSGGQETARFFRRLGFTVVTGSDLSPSPSGRGEHRHPGPPRSGRRLDRVTQKTALQRLLQKRFGTVVSEGALEWLRVPRPEELDPLYTRLLRYCVTIAGMMASSSQGVALPSISMSRR